MENNKVKNIHWFPGHMKKASNKIEEQVKLVDFVIVLLDSRIPLSSKNKMLEKIVESKPKLYILTKPDLSDDKITSEWVNKLTCDGNIAVSIDLTNNKSKDELFKIFAKFSKQKEEKYLKKGIKNVTTKAMVLGIPNVGKSTLINLFSGKKLTKVGNSAGVTKNINWLKINNFELMDVPGILEPSYEDKNKAINLALIGSMNENILPNDELSDHCLDFLRKYYLDEFYKKYQIDLSKVDNYDAKVEIAKSRGFLLKGNEADIDKVEKIILNEFRNGKITKLSLERP